MKSLTVACAVVALAGLCAGGEYHGGYYITTTHPPPPPSPPPPPPPARYHDFAPAPALYAYGPLPTAYGYAHDVAPAHNHAEHEPCPSISRVHLPPVRIHFSDLPPPAVHHDVPRSTAAPYYTAPKSYDVAPHPAPAHHTKIAHDVAPHHASAYQSRMSHDVVPHQSFAQPSQMAHDVAPAYQTFAHRSPMAHDVAPHHTPTHHKSHDVPTPHFSSYGPAPAHPTPAHVPSYGPPPPEPTTTRAPPPAYGYPAAPAHPAVPPSHPALPVAHPAVLPAHPGAPTSHHTTVSAPSPLASFLNAANSHVSAHMQAVDHLTKSHESAHGVTAEHAHATKTLAMGHAAAVQALASGHAPSAFPSHPASSPSPNSPRASILRYDGEIEEGRKVSYNFDASNGIHDEGLTTVDIVPGGPNECDKALIKKSGQTSYISPEGIPIHISYVADKDGYRPIGSHLPTPPPVPEGIQRGLAQLRAAGKL